MHHLRMRPRLARISFCVALPASLLCLALLTACSQSDLTATTAPGTRANDNPSKLASSAKGAPAPTTCTPIADAVQRVEQSVVRLETPPDAQGEISAGTGFVIDSDVVLTNQHVVAGTEKILVTFDSIGAGRGRRAFGEVLATNEAQDLALIQVDTGQVPAIVWGDDRTLARGTPLTAIGYARDKPGRPAVTSGKYLQTYVDPPSGQAYLLTNVLLDHGDSGGPLLNDCGQVIGVNTAKIRSEERASLSIPEFLAHRWATEQIQLQR